ncbi:hypothetical protein SASPL_100476 [Salvia splendens]|uniref:Uncharacterized protein n=1 Tax=Salvia splendens TaxID=180675 RepID=A0A8X9AAB4_SALSN|nr:hypothetical protein SASPL_100476 [Salvia splendens]
MERIPETQSLSRQLLLAHNFLQEAEELMSFTASDDSSDEEAGPTSFRGASHPAEPVDTDIMRPVYVPIGQNNVDGRYLITSPFLKDLSIRVPSIEPSPSILSPAGS